eukprot:scaffold3202_cov117-Isochrysis_galbana.AAC.9
MHADVACRLASDSRAAVCAWRPQGGDGSSGTCVLADLDAALLQQRRVAGIVHADGRDERRQPVMA